MQTPLKQFRERYRATLLDFLWREWTALGVTGSDTTPRHHVSDPEALLLFTCTLGRHDQRLFDEVMDWLLQNGRFLNVQRLRNIQAREDFRGGVVLSAVADWLTTQGASSKWKLLAKRPELGNVEAALTTRTSRTAKGPARQGRRHRVQEEPEFANNYPLSTIHTFFYLPTGRPMPLSREQDPLFLRHGFQRNPLKPRGYSQPFHFDSPAAQLLRLRALFGVNARCEILDYLASNTIGHPREIARELYYSQKTVHDTLSDLACSGVVHSSKGPRERVFRVSLGKLPFLDRDTGAPGWINWPVLLSAAERVWHLADDLSAVNLEPAVVQSEILLAIAPLEERLGRARWMSDALQPSRSDSASRLESFHALFKHITE